MLPQTILNFLVRRRFQRFLIGAFDGFDRAAFVVRIARPQSGIIRALVMVASAYCIKCVDRVRARDMLLAQMRRAICKLGVAPDNIQGAIGIDRTLPRRQGIVPVTTTGGPVGGSGDLSRCRAEAV